MIKEELERENKSTKDEGLEVNTLNNSMQENKQENNELKTRIVGSIRYNPEGCFDSEDKMIRVSDLNKMLDNRDNKFIEKLNKEINRKNEQINRKLEEKDKIIVELKNEVEKWKKIAQEKIS